MTEILENVKNIKTHDNGETLKIITKLIEECGYSWKAELLNTCIHSSIPQNRERMYIVCFKNSKLCDKFNFPKHVLD